MAELLVMVVDKESSGDPTQDQLRYQAGDVVVVMEDGHAWGAAEISDPQFRIIKLPKIPAAALAQTVVPALEKSVVEEGKSRVVLRRRAHRLDAAALDAEKAKGADVSLAKVLAVVVEKVTVDAEIPLDVSVRVVK